MFGHQSVLRGSLVATFVLVGCIADETHLTPQKPGEWLFKVSEDEQTSAVVESVEMPEGGWDWEFLAVRAGEKAKRNGPGALDVLVEKLKTAEETAWKDPELRTSVRWGDTSGSKRSWETGLADGADHESGDSRSTSIGARFYIPNPFINRYLRRKGAAAVARSEAKAAVEAYGVYTEVKLLCHEVHRVSHEIMRCVEIEGALSRCKYLDDGEQDGSLSLPPYEAIRLHSQRTRNRMKMKLLQRHLRHLNRLVAKAADVDIEGFTLAPRGRQLPDPAALSSAALVEYAFARRPDLAQAIAELEVAEANLSAAKAATIPWFRFVEAGYRHDGKDEDSRGWNASKTGPLAQSAKSDGHSDEVFVEVALTVPIFTWFGDTVSISRRIRDAADNRVQELYSSISAEVLAALERYRDAVSDVDPEEVETFTFEMKRRINECENSGAGVVSDSLKARLALIDFLGFAEEREDAAIEAAIALESVIGGPTGAPVRPRGTVQTCEYWLALDGQEIVPASIRISAMPFNRVFPGKQRPLDQTRMARLVRIEEGSAKELRLMFEKEKMPKNITMFPMSREPAKVVGSEVVVGLSGAEQFILDFGKEAEPLHVFVEKPWKYEPQDGDRYFGPGVHEAGVIVAKPGERIVLDRGAVVKGEIFANQADGLVITGRGTLDCSTMDRQESAALVAREDAGLPEHDSEDACAALVISNSKNVRIDGIVVQDTPFWSILVCRGSQNVEIEDVKVIGQWRYNADGVEVSGSSDVLVKDCFFRTFDDSVVVRGAYLAGEHTPTRNVVVENCNLWCDWSMNIEICTIHIPTAVENVTFRNNRLMNVARYAAGVSSWFGSKDTAVRNVTFDGLELDLRPDRPREVYQNSDEQRFIHDPWTEQVIFDEIIREPSRHLGGLRFAPDGDFSGYKSVHENIVVKNFKVYGEKLPLKASARTLGPNQKIQGLRFENMPEFTLETRGDVQIVRPEAE